MGRLDKCLKKSNIPQSLAEDIMSERDKYVEDGYDKTEAKILAVKDALDTIDISIEGIFNRALRTDSSEIDFGGVHQRVEDLGINDRDTVLNELYDSIGDNLGRLQSIGALHIADSVNDIEGEPVYSSDGVPVAFYEDGVITIIASNVPKGQAKNIMLHEGFHKAMAEDAVLMGLHDKVLWEFKSLIGKSDAVDAAYRMVPEKTDKSLWDEEAFAYFLQNPSNRKSSLFKKVLSNIKAFFVRLGFDLSLISEADFVAIAEQSVRAAYRQGRATATGRRYSKIGGRRKLFNHSGGAKGSDSVWDRAGRAFGVKTTHYFVEGNKTPKGNKSISLRDSMKADKLLHKANKKLKRTFPTKNEYTNSLLRRNAWQVGHADEIFAVSEFGPDGNVKGGTAWAVQMAIDMGKPVHVFDQINREWKTWDGREFVTEPRPYLTENFAGIGTRQINKDGIDEIRKVYQKTFIGVKELNNRFIRSIGKYKSSIAITKSNKPVKNPIEMTRDWDKRSKAQKVFEAKVNHRREMAIMIDTYFPSGVLESEADRLRFIELNSREAVQAHIAEFKTKWQIDNKAVAAFVDYLDRFYPDQNTDIAAGGKAVNRGLSTDEYAIGDNNVSSTPSQEDKKWGWIKPLTEKTKEANNIFGDDVTEEEAFELYQKRNIDALARLHTSLIHNKYFNQNDPYSLSIEYMKRKQDELALEEGMDNESISEVLNDREDYKEVLNDMKKMPEKSVQFKDAMEGKLRTLADFVVYSLSAYAGKYSINDILTAAKRENGLYRNWRTYPESLDEVIFYLQNKELDLQEQMKEDPDWIAEDVSRIETILNGKSPEIIKALNEDPREVQDIWMNQKIPQEVEAAVARGIPFGKALDTALSAEDAHKDLIAYFDVNKDEAKDVLAALSQVYWLDAKEAYQQAMWNKETGRNSSISRKMKPREKAAVKKQEDILNGITPKQQELNKRAWENLKNSGYKRASTEEIRQILSAIKGLAIAKKKTPVNKSIILDAIINDKKVSDDLKNRLLLEKEKGKANEYRTLTDVLDALSFLNNPWVQTNAGLPLAEAEIASRGTLPDEQEPFLPTGSVKIVNRKESAAFIRTRHRNDISEYQVDEYIESAEYADVTKFILDRAYDNGYIYKVLKKAYPKYSEYGLHLREEQIYSRNPNKITQFDVAYSESLLEMYKNAYLDSTDTEEKAVISKFIQKYENIIADLSTPKWIKKNKDGSEVVYKTAEEKMLGSRNDLNFNIMDYKALIASDILANDMPVDAKFFEDLSASLSKQEVDITAEELFGVYNEVGNNETVFKARVSKMLHNKKLALASAVFDGAKDLSPQERMQLERELADEYSYNPRDNKKQINNSFRSLILSELSARDANYGVLPDLLSAKYNHVNAGELFKPLLKFKQEEAWSKHAKIVQGSFRRERVQAYYKDLAESLGAELRVIDDPTKEIQSGFFPAVDGETSKFIINVNDAPRTGRIIAQEAMYRMISKTDKRDSIISELLSLGKDDIGEKTFSSMVEDAREKNPTLSNYDLENIAAANIFAHYAFNPSFHKDFILGLSDSNVTEDVAQVYVNLIENLNKIAIKVSGGLDSTASLLYENRKLITSPDIDGIYELVADMIGGPALKEAAMSSNDGSINRAYAKLGTVAAAEIKSYATKPIKPVHGFWKKLFTPNTKNYKNLMTNIENIIKEVLQWVKRVKTKKHAADFMAKQIDVDLASYPVHGYEREVYRVQKKIEKFSSLFNSLPETALTRFHDRIVRGLRVEDDGSVTNAGPLDFSLDKDVATALEEGIPNEIVEAYKIYKEETDALFEKLKEHYPDLNYRAAHYGQSLKWVKDNGNTIDTEFAELMYPERSAAEGRKQYLEAKNTTETTFEIAARTGSKPESMNPNRIMLDYIKDANTLIKTKEMLIDGMSEGRIKIFANGTEAAKEGFYPVDDPAFEITSYGEERSVEVGVRVLLRRNNTVKIIGTFPNEATAQAFIDKKKGSGFEIAPASLITGGKDTVARYYFSRDLAGMLTNVYAKDKVKAFEAGPLTGKRLLKAKNWTTAIEFAFSMFHAMTIAQEHMASSMSWQIQKQKGFKNRVKAISNPLSVFKNGLKDSREIRALFDEYHKNTDVGKDPAFQKKFNDILGTTNMDVVDMIDKFFMAGGLVEQDSELRANAFSYGKMKYTSNEIKVVKNKNGDYEVVSALEGLGPVATVRDISSTSIDSIKQIHADLIAKNPDNPVANMLKTMSFASTQATTAWLMESGIPKIKMAMWFKEYSQKLERYDQEIKNGTMTKEGIARDTMKFVEDRFGEVNWKNQWMNPSYKSALIFLFRSFTWFTGSWKALSKAGIDVGKLLWFKAKGENYELTEKGWWGVNAIISHLMVAGVLNLAYMTIAGIGGGEAEDDQDVDLISRVLFPRINPQDPYDRITVPSYVTELYKIMHHLGILGNEFEPTKLISGRFNTILGNLMEVYEGQDFRGVEIRNSHDMLAKQAIDSFLHIFAVAPIAMSSAYDDIRREGFKAEKLAYSFMGMTDAPAVAKRSKATSYAYSLTRKKFSSMTTSNADAAMRDKVSRAAVKYGEGDPEDLNNLLYSGDIGTETYKKAIARLKKINGRPNPRYKKPLVAALKRLSIEEALGVWDEMTDDEKEMTRSLIVKKYFNIIHRKGSRGTKSRHEIYTKMKELEIF